MKDLSGSAIFHIPMNAAIWLPETVKTTSALVTGEVLVKQQKILKVQKTLRIFLIKYYLFFLKFSEAINNTAPTNVPTTNASKYINGLLTAPTAIANIPPCGAFDTEPNTILNAPATPLDKNNGGITRNGLLAANGIAPSVINANPIT